MIHNSMSTEILGGHGGRLDRRLLVHVQFLHGTVESDPRIKSINESLFFLVCNKKTVVPSSTPVNTMKNDSVIHEHEICFYLMIEIVGQINVGHIFGLRFSPIPTGTTSLRDGWYEFQHFIWYASPVKELLHTSC